MSTETRFAINRDGSPGRKFLLDRASKGLYVARDPQSNEPLAYAMYANLGRRGDNWMIVAADDADRMRQLQDRGQSLSSVVRGWASDSDEAIRLLKRTVAWVYSTPGR
jgi:hypothetical protein